MSDVRDQLIKTLRGLDYLLPDQQVADAILARFEVTPRPVVTAEQMGRIMRSACLYSVVTDGGQYALDELAKRGLTIVRREEVGK